MEEKINSGVTRAGEIDIRLNLIDSFPNHPYHVFDDEDMTELTASIEANGLLNPVIVRSKADGRYELISGHRRKRAYEILKIKKIHAIIVDVSDDEAIIMMVDSNCQRSKIPLAVGISHTLSPLAMRIHISSTNHDLPILGAPPRIVIPCGSRVSIQNLVGSSLVSIKVSPSITVSLFFFSLIDNHLPFQ